MYEIITWYNVNLYNVLFQLYLNKIGWGGGRARKEKKSKKKEKRKNKRMCCNEGASKSRSTLAYVAGNAGNIRAEN